MELTPFDRRISQLAPPHEISDIPSKVRPVCADRAIRTFREMLDKRIEPDQQWIDLVYPILVSYNYKFVHSTVEFTPNEAREPSNELMTYISMILKAKHNRRYPENHIGNNVKIYQKTKLFKKGHVSKW